MADDDLSQEPEHFEAVGEQFAAGFLKHFTLDSVTDTGVNVLIKSTVALPRAVLKMIEPLALEAGKVLIAVEEPILPLFGAFIAPIVAGMFGSQADPALFSSRANREGRSEASAGLVDAYMRALVGQAGGEAKSGDEGAKRIAGAAVHAALEGWFNGWVLEMLGELVPWEWLKFKDMTKLPEDIERALGLGRLVRRAFAPLIDATAATPMKWAANKTYRPNLLSEGEILKAFQRGDYSADETEDELARLGYSAKRQDMLSRSALKRLSLDEMWQLRRTGSMNDDVIARELHDLGYDADTAAAVVDAKRGAFLGGIDDRIIAHVVGAFVNRDLTGSQLRDWLATVIHTEDELAAWAGVAELEREINVRHLSSGEVIDCVELGILPTAFYRDWLVREGYPPEEALALEIRLRMKIDKQVQVDEARQQAEADRAAADQARAAAAAARQADVDAARALHRRGTLADLARAVVRGLIPITRYEEVVGADYDADTVAILTGLVEGDRQTFLDQQQRADDARQRATIRHIDVGALEQAVLADLLTAPEFRQRLTMLGFPAGDADLLTATLTARKTDLDEARAKRAQADGLAKAKRIDLGRAERLVRKGGATLEQYAALLGSLGYDEGSQAAMVALLQLEIDDDAAAAAAREAAKGKKTATGLTLEQFRRAVIAGVKTDAEFQTYLVTEGYTSEAQLVLLAELRRDVADAESARRKREAAEAASGVVALPLSRVSTAARLGLIPASTYRARLARDGYTADDITIEMDLLVSEIADVQAARARRDALASQTDAPRALSIAQVERAVKAGTATIGDYRAAVAAVYGADDVTLLVSTLQAELSSLADAAARRTTIDGELTARTLSLGQIEAAVLAGAVSLDQYQQQLVSWGYGTDDAGLLAALLFDKLNRAAAGG
jgi:hypothetical protein